jgi:putative hydrolase of the HAD superfamily
VTPAAITDWVFDLDNTLYPASANLFAQIDVRMAAFIGQLLGLPPEEARALQKRYFREHGTTLRGLMDSHGVAPRDFLDFVHDIDLTVLTPDPRVIDGLARLPGRKLVFTNGDAAYAGRVLAALGLEGAFDGVIDIEATGWAPKPMAEAYRTLAGALPDPRRALFVEDMARNLRPAKALGMATVWVDNGSEHGDHEACPSFIDLRIHDVGAWLEGLALPAAA